MCCNKVFTAGSNIFSGGKNFEVSTQLPEVTLTEKSEGPLPETTLTKQSCSALISQYFL